jgi:transcriptional regulator with PAS, ATPase and Fis domain
MAHEKPLRTSEHFMTAQLAFQSGLRAVSSAGSAKGQGRFQGMIGNGEGMQKVFSLIERIAPYFRAVLVTGETGTGKELAARALHDLSSAHKGHFVVLNCSAVVETLFESELFGHTRGAFTGAHADKIGLIEYAHGGTLFLDEIGDMPLATQAKLLRVLQNREVQRVGSLSAKKVDVRIVAATNKDLRKAVTERQFREDLFYRLSMVDVHLPPLRERPEDLPSLVAHIIREWSHRLGKPVLGVTDEVRKVFRAHVWPGNVRELENVIGHACMIADAQKIDIPDLPDYLAKSRKSNTGVPRLEIPGGLSNESFDSIDEMESRLVRQALLDAAGNQLKAAKLLHTTRDKLRYRMKKYGLMSEGKLARAHRA